MSYMKMKVADVMEALKTSKNYEQISNKMQISVDELKNLVKTFGKDNPYVKGERKLK